MNEQTLAQLVRAKHPGVYDDMDDQQLEAAVRAKYPGEYDDLPSSSSTPRADASRAKVLPRPVPPPQTARELARERPGKYVNEMLRNVPGDVIEQGKNLATGTYDLLSVLAKATGEVGHGIGNFTREAIGFDPVESAGTENIEALGRVPGALLSHYGQYADPDFRAERVREHPIGMAVDMAPVSAALKTGVPAMASSAEAGASAVAKAPGRVIDTTVGVLRGSPWAALRGITGHGPVESVRGLFERMTSRSATESSAAAAAPAAPSSPPASSPVTPAPAAAQSAPASAPTPSAGSTRSPQTVQVRTLPGETLTVPPSARTKGQMSPQAIQNDLGIANRRLGTNLTEPQYKAATELVHQGYSPVEAVAEVARRPSVVPAMATPTTDPTAPPPTTTTAKGKRSTRQKLTADEADEYLRLTEKGLSHEEATQALIGQRNLMKRLGTKSPDAVRKDVAERNATGRWPQDK